LADTFTGSIRTQNHEKFWRKGSVGVSRDGPNFFECPLLSQERVKLRTSYLADVFQRVHANKNPLKIWENRERRRIQELPKFLEYPLLSQEWVKLRTSNLADIFRGYMRTKAD